MALNENVVDAVTNENFKVGAGGPAFYLNLAMGDAVSHQRSMNSIREAAVGNIVRRMTELDPSESAAILKTTQGDLAAQLASYMAVIANAQQTSKTAGNTPPVTP